MAGTLTALETLTLHDPATGARAAIAPGRGGLVTRFSVAGRPLLFLDEATLLDPAKNVRGGVPVLFPSPGRLAGGRFARAGRAGALGQHGFARNLAWVVDEKAAGATAAAPAAAKLRLESTPETRAAFPWDCALEYRFSLRGAALRIEQRFENRDREPMPFACGFHPYFRVPQPEKARTRVETAATRAFDNRAQRQVQLDGPIDLTQDEVDLHLEDHGRSDCALLLADGARIEVSGSEAFGRWVVWTLAGKDFVCLEPWSAPADALNTGSGLLSAPPGGAGELWTELRFHPTETKQARPHLAPASTPA